MLEAVLPDEVGGDVRGEGVTCETEEGFSVGEGHSEGGGHAEDGVLGGMAVGVGDEAGVGGTADPGGVVESDGIAAVDFADALLQTLGERARVAGLQAGEKVVEGGFLMTGSGEFAGDFGMLFRGYVRRGVVIVTHVVIFFDGRAGKSLVIVRYFRLRWGLDSRLTLVAEGGS